MLEHILKNDGINYSSKMELKGKVSALGVSISSTKKLPPSLKTGNFPLNSAIDSFYATVEMLFFPYSFLVDVE